MTFPVIHSVPDPTAIGRLVEERFDVGHVTDVKLYRSYANEVYHLGSENGARCFLKVYRRTWHDRESVGWEVALQRHLRRHGVGVTVPIAQVTGEDILTINTPEGERSAVLYEEAPGQKPRAPLDPALYERFGQAAARLHEAMDAFTSHAPRPARNVDGMVTRSAAVIESAVDADLETLRSLRELAGWLGPELQKRSDDLEFGVCHGDLTLDNLTITTDGGITFFDFDLAAEGYRAAEHAGLYGWTLIEPVAKAYWGAFLEGYRRVRPFSQAEEESMPLHLAAYQLWELAHEIENWRNWSGYSRITDEMIADRIRHVRDSTSA